MIVCLCEGVSDKRIREEIECGACTLEDIKKECGAGGECGGCIFMLIEILNEVKPLDKLNTHVNASKYKNPDSK
ncbi:MAG: (2Fe-2S)-binding protein [bacterium]|nr:(2Fe-2S)-binding protein [bacterium]